MWSRLLIYWYIVITLPVYGHISDYVSTPSSQIEQYCIRAEKCMHDTVRVCGMFGKEYRVFLDTCDILEFGCDTNKLYTHVDDENCPELVPAADK